MQEIKGDLLKMASDGEFDIIIHGCNCQHTMGAGIAGQLRKWPEVYEADLKTPRGSDKLGCFSHATISREGHRPFTVINAYTQEWPGKDLREWAMASALIRVAQSYPLEKIGMCKIGAGIAGGDWNDLKKMVEVIFKDIDLTVVEYQV